SPLSPAPRLPPPFPYTTLFRSANIHLASAHFLFVLDRDKARRLAHFGLLAVDLEPARFGHDPALGLERFALDSGDSRGDEILRRSEEHTSELQSRENLVCRLLL